MVSDFLSWANVTKQPITTAAENGEGGECRRYLQFDLWWIKTNSWGPLLLRLFEHGGLSQNLESILVAEGLSGILEIPVPRAMEDFNSCEVKVVAEENFRSFKAW